MHQLSDSEEEEDRINSCQTKMHQLSDSEEENGIKNEEEECKKSDEIHGSDGKQENVKLVSNGNSVEQNIGQLRDDEEEEEIKNKDETCEKSNEVHRSDGSEGNLCLVSNVVRNQPNLQQSCGDEDKGFIHEEETCKESSDVHEKEEVCEDKNCEEVTACEGSSVPSLQNSNESCIQNIVCQLLCSYGDKCYRKNPDHKKAYCHPWDPDYETVFNSLPACPYGARCYRKNKAHWQTHTHLPAAATSARPVKRVKKQTTAVTMQASDLEDDDSADSFLNDASSDDYQPTDTGSDYSDSDSISDDGNENTDEPDTKRMKKEAKRFLRKKK